MTAFPPHPLLAERLRLQQASPFFRVLGIDLLELGGGIAVARMAPGCRVARSAEDARIDPLALVGLLDDVFGNAVGTVVPVAVGMSTLDLRLGFGPPGLPVGAVTAHTRVVLLDEHCATAVIEARDETGVIVVTGTALFTLGSYPGGILPDLALIGNYVAPTTAGPFRHLIGLEVLPDGPRLRGDNPHVVGFETSAALHGGAVGALLMAACQHRIEAIGDNKRLATLELHFLRPGSAMQPLESSSAIVRPGRAATFITASCHHDPARPVGTASATFVAV